MATPPALQPSGSAERRGSTPSLAETGLTDAEVRARREAGQANVVDAEVSRTWWEIARANLVTRFNILLGSLLAVVLVIQAWEDALFGVVLLSNVFIGVVQEVRAKRTLDRLALINTPKARVVRNNTVVEVDVTELVVDDVLDLAAGDQVPVDGRVLDGRGLEVDESMLTGESEPVAKGSDEDVLSGSVVLAGSGRVLATRVGAGAYAARLAAEGRKFELVRSELRSGTDRILAIVTWGLVPTAILLTINQLRLGEPLRHSLPGVVAGVGAMVPEGLVLLTSLAFAVGVIRLGRRRVLVQELAAVEVLARVDTVCVDKTGTLTEGVLELDGIESVNGDDEPNAVAASAADDDVRAVLGALHAAEARPNATLSAIGDECPDPGWTAEATVPFGSAHKWSGATFAGRGTWLLGAPDVLLPDEESPARRRAAELAAHGVRTLLLARTEAPLAPTGAPAAGTTAEGRADTDGARPSAPVVTEAIEPVALVRLAEQMRPDAADTIRYFHDQGVAVKVISGDHPLTVGAIARLSGVEAADDPFDARDFPDDPEELAELVEKRSVFGRVTPDQKQAMVQGLRRRGHVVAMTGDGINDVLALKHADIAVAMGSGSPATRAVARLVLLDDSFASLPHVVQEGRRVIGNVERVANLFVTKTVYAFVLALAIGLASWPFPFLPRHLTLISSLTIGIPAFFLALAPNHRRAMPGFATRVLRFAGPAGAIAAAATFFGYAVARQLDLSGPEADTVAVLVLFVVALWVLFVLARPMTRPRILLVLTMVGLFVLAFLVPFSREFFELRLLSAEIMFLALGVGAGGAFLVELGWQVQASRLGRKEARLVREGREGAQ